MYNFICEFYNISKMQQQIDQYYKLNGVFSMKMMFKATNNMTIVNQANYDKDTMVNQNVSEMYQPAQMQ